MKKSFILVLSLLICLSGVSLAQKAKKNFTITGRVTDAAQKPVPGATVFIDQEKTGSVTNENGEYRIRVSSKAKEILVFTLLYGAAEQAINERTTIDFIVGEKSAENKKEITTDNKNTPAEPGRTSAENVPTGVVDARDPKYAHAQTIYDMIRGRFAGVEVSGNSIRIRGERSLNVSNEPIFVVDGVIVNSLDGISPQTVKSIEVLKGPDASIYGTRGANGVIIITLVSGKDK